jgi:glycerol-3-phosphate dehydrogenase
MFDFRLVREALKERGLLLQRLAPHLVRPVAFVYPLTHRGWERVYVAAGLTLYDGLAAVSRTANGVPRHKHLTKTQALALVPSLRKDALVGAVQYYDAQVATRAIRCSWFAPLSPMVRWPRTVLG